MFKVADFPDRGARERLTLVDLPPECTPGRAFPPPGRLPGPDLCLPKKAAWTV